MGHNVLHDGAYGLFFVVLCTFLTVLQCVSDVDLVSSGARCL